MRRRAPLLVAAVILSGIAYWSSPRLEEPKPTPSAAPATIKVPFLVKAKVGTILEQQRKIALAGSRGDVAAAETRVRLAVRDIKARLVSDGVHQEAAMLEVVRAAAHQCGFSDQEASAVVAAFHSADGGKKSGAIGFVGGMRKAMAEMTGLPQSTPVDSN